MEKLSSSTAFGPELQIHQVSQLLKIPSGSLRNWQDRYGFLSHASEQGNYRRTYKMRDICHLDTIGRLVQYGEKPKVLCSLEPSALRARLQNHTPSEFVAAKEQMLGALHFKNLDGFESLLAAVLLSAETCEFVIEPSFEAIGTLWHSGHFTIEDEHLFSGLLRSWIQRSTSVVQADERSREIVIAGLSKESHEGAALVMNSIFRMHGLVTRQLGIGLPIEELVRLDGDQRKRIFVLTATMCDKAFQSQLESLLQFRNPVVMGGRGIDQYLNENSGNSNLRNMSLIDSFAAARFAELLAKGIRLGYFIA